MDTTQVSLMKITPPIPKTVVLRRPALAKKMRLLAHATLGLIHAEMGYGKSTAVSTYLHDAGIKASWYRCGEEDAELSLFLQGLLESIRRYQPEFGQNLRERLKTAREQSARLDGREMAELFLQECITCPQLPAVVLDDYHLIREGWEADRFVEKIAMHLPLRGKLLILTRTRPRWSGLDLMAARGDCMELSTPDLAFTREESETFYQDEYEVILHVEEWDRVEQVAQGWIMALRSFGERVARGNTVADSLRELSRLMYLLEAEVWAKLDPDMQKFLIESAVFTDFDAQDCSQVLGEKSVELLHEAKRSHLFLLEDSDGNYSFHPLFRRLMASKLASNPAAYLRVNRQAAHWYHRKGEAGKAYECLRLAEEWELLGEWLAQASEGLLMDGKLDLLYHWASVLPIKVKDDHHWLWFYQAEVERYRCIYRQAFDSYQVFIGLCEQKNDRHGLCRGLEGLARVHLDSVQNVRAEELLKRAIQLLPADVPERELASRLYRLLAEIYTNRGDAKQAADWYQRSQELEHQTEVELESRLLFRTGRLQEAISLLEEKWTLEQTRHPALTRSYRETSLLLSFVFALNGEWERGWAAAETAIELGQAAHSPFVEANGYVRKAHAALISQELPFDEIRKLYEKGLRMMEELQSTRGKSETLLGLTLLYGKEKALEQALFWGRRGMQETEAMRDDWLNSLVRLAVGIAYAKSGKDEEAVEMIQDCSERLCLCKDSYGVVICQLWLGLLAYRNKKWDLFDQAMTHALLLMQTGEYEFLLQRPTMLTPHDVQAFMPVLLEASRRQIAPDYVASLMGELGLQQVSFHPGYTLRIQTMGQFRVWLGEQELQDKAWQRGNAKLLFQLLITKRHQMLTREEIINLLWEGRDDESATRDFKVALNAVHKALEPDRAARTDAFFIQRHGSSYGFNIASGYHIDVEEFEKWVSRGLEERDLVQAARMLEKGLAYYQGSYLPECRYEEWCSSERDRMQELFLRGAERLARIGLQRQDWEKTIRWCEAILRVDDCWEEAYRLLMRAYFQQNNRTQAIRWYEKCVNKLKEQLGVEPMPATVATYHQIIGD